MRLRRWLSSVFAGERPSEPATPARSPGDLVLLGRAQGEAEAELWRNILAQWGVLSLVKNVSALAYTSTGDMFEVWVRQDDAEYARELLGLGQGDEVPDAQEDGADDELTAGPP